MKVINFKEWKENSKNNANHLKVNKRFEDMDELEVRLLLKKIVERLNFSIDHLYKSYAQHEETYKIIDDIVSNQNNLIETKKALISLSKKTQEALHEQARVVQILMSKNS